MKKIIFFVLLNFFFLVQIFSQVSTIYVAFKDNKTKLYGIRSLETQEIVVSAKYQQIINNNDSLISIRENDLCSIVDFEGNILIKPIEHFLWIENFDPNHYGKVRAGDLKSPYFVPPYFINKDGICIPENYYPCPSYGDLDSLNISEDLLMLQRAVNAAVDGQFKKAVELAEKAIELNPENPSNYYWYANFILDIHNIVYSNAEPNKNKFPKAYILNLERNIGKAIDLETDTIYLIDIYNLKHRFERKFTKNKKEERIAYGKLKSFDTEVDHRGMMLQIGTSYLNAEYSSEILLGIGGYNRKLRSHKYQSIFFGLGYEQFWQTKTNSFKISSTYLAPWYFMLGIDVGIMKNVNSKDFFVSPEVGIHYHGAQLTYGYNFVSINEFPAHRRHYISLKYELVLFGRKYFLRNKQ